MGSNMKDTPPYVDYGQLLVLRGSSWSDTLTQITFSYNSQEMYFRSGTLTSFSSKSWSRMLTDQNYTSFCATANHTHSYLPLSGGSASGSVWASTSSGSEIDLGVSNTGGLLYLYGTSSGCGLYSSKAGSLIWADKAGGTRFSGVFHGTFYTENKGSSLPSSGADGEIFFKTI